MNTALLLADRPAAALGPLNTCFTPTLLPVAGKPVIEHSLEDLRDGGIRVAVIVLAAGDTVTRASLGDGARFGLKLSYAGSALEAAAACGDEKALLVMRGDVLRGRAVRRFLTLTGAFDGQTVFALDGALPLGLALMEPASPAVAALAWPLRDTAPIARPARAVQVSQTGCSGLGSLAAYYAVTREVLQGRYAGLQPSGRGAAAGGGWRAPLAGISARARIEGPVRIGRQATVNADVLIRGACDIGDGAVIDTGAEVIDSIVMPGTYVGRGTRLEHAVASGCWLYRADLDLLTRVEDSLLLDGPSVRFSPPLTSRSTAPAPLARAVNR